MRNGKQLFPPRLVPFSCLQIREFNRKQNLTVNSVVWYLNLRNIPYTQCVRPLPSLITLFFTLFLLSPQIPQTSNIPSAPTTNPPPSHHNHNRYILPSYSHPLNRERHLQRHTTNTLQTIPTVPSILLSPLSLHLPLQHWYFQTPRVLDRARPLLTRSSIDPQRDAVTER